jgi:subtilase family serine protease
MESRRRRSLRLKPDASGILEGRALLSAFRVPHVHPSHATIRPWAERSATPATKHSPAGHAARAHPLLLTIRAGRSGSPLAASGPPSEALTPAQTRHIYGLDRISNLGTGQTIAIVDAYDDPNIFADADVFDQQFMTTLGGSTSYYAACGASSTWLTKANPSGVTPSGDTGWGTEISLDVEWAHAIAPQAHILLVEANSDSDIDLLAADDYAVAHGASVISNSWGSYGEFSWEIRNDSHFTAKGVTFVFSSGDGGIQSYPAVCPYVLSVGGTSLSHDTNDNWTGEVGWSGGGGGVSRFEAKPGYQKGLSYDKRANPDVAYDADPNTGFAVYDSYGGYGWDDIFGGTSAGAPQWSSLIAIADQGRVSAHKSVLDGYSQTLPAIYAMTTGTTGSEQLNDVTSGRNRVGPAGRGFDLVTGRGTPRRADLVYQALISY